MVEVALMSPWVLLLFVGIFDVGFYLYAAINTQNAANVAALLASSETGYAADSVTACAAVREEMKHLPNVTPTGACGSAPLTVTATSSPAPCDPALPCDTTVAVTYESVQLFPIPGLMGKMTLTRRAVMRVHPE